MMRPLVLLVVLLAFGAGPTYAQQEFSFFLSAVDASGTPIADIRPEEIVVSVNGADATVKRMEPIAWPVKVQVLVDNGQGTGSQLLQFRNGLRGFFEALPAGVEGSLLTLAPQPRWIVRPTTDRVQLANGVGRIAPDDSGARFIDGIVEAAGRIDEQNTAKNRHFPILVVLSTTGAEGSSSRETHVDKAVQQLLKHAATVHIIMLGTGPRSANDVTGRRQVIVGKHVVDSVGGVYEAIAAESRVQTLLPEIGELVGRAHARQSRQYLVTVERARGDTGPLQDVSLQVTRQGASASASVDGRVRELAVGR
jgi:hypothetical protein